MSSDTPARGVGERARLRASPTEERLHDATAGVRPPSLLGRLHSRYAESGGRRHETVIGELAVNLVGPYRHALEPERAVRCGHRDIGGIAAVTDDDAPDARH